MRYQLLFKASNSKNSKRNATTGPSMRCTNNTKAGGARGGDRGIYHTKFHRGLNTQQGLISYFRWCFSPQEVKLRPTFLANFSKTAEQKQTPLLPFVAQLETRIISKNEPNRCIFQEVIAKIMYRTK